MKRIPSKRGKYDIGQIQLNNEINLPTTT